MTRYARGYRKVFLEHNGSGPWNCAYDGCEELIYVFGRKSREGAIHHKDENKHNNEPDNLEIMHFGCHRRHHMIGRDVSDKTRANMSAAQKGRIVSDEARAKVSKAHTGRIVSEEWKANMRVGHAKRSPEEKSAQAKKASEARWAKHRKQS